MSYIFSEQLQIALASHSFSLSLSFIFNSCLLYISVSPVIKPSLLFPFDLQLNTLSLSLSDSPSLSRLYTCWMQWGMRSMGELIQKWETPTSMACSASPDTHSSSYKGDYIHFLTSNLQPHYSPNWNLILISAMNLNYCVNLTSLKDHVSVYKSHFIFLPTIFKSVDHIF